MRFCGQQTWFPIRQVEATEHIFMDVTYIYIEWMKKDLPTLKKKIS